MTSDKFGHSRGTSNNHATQEPTNDPRASEPHPIDVAVGQQMKERRTGLRISRKVLARDIGVSPQQIAKYEHGLTRISASALYVISDTLGILVEELFHGVDDRLCTVGPTDSAPLDNHALKNDLMDFLEVYVRIENPVIRRTLLDVIRAMGSTES
ncbi:helix-turn-helix domain-containing protein [Magnetospira sp. QH-2]|uniref:helix-turn-helix domain-containing protein n=1 Tax=Magnetospira sp. (strain QH-2) TaxID=1288970 RepID=UPI0003E8121B|nr:helix-turn-helix transcriptional regulator [Magnetospira sp. QH-2]CCQ72562.1 putative HTH-type transcriptional regulator [Magnetospira sp. QH-2]